MDFTLYWFMFPLAILIASTAMLSGIAGAALFMPIFLLLFPLLGSAYVPGDPIVSVAAALITSTFGFASGFVGYYRKGLIDFRQALPFLAYSIPLALLGSWVCSQLSADVIRLAYGSMMLMLVYVLMRKEKDLSAESSSTTERRDSRKLMARNGVSYTYVPFRPGIWPSFIGGFFTGLLSTGIGEVTMPQLVKAGRIPVPVAAATSVLVVIGTFFFASAAHMINLIHQDGLQAVPWHLVCYTIPGVIIGGQIGPGLQGRFPREAMVRGISIVFLAIGVAMIATFVKEAIYY